MRPNKYIFVNKYDSERYVFFHGINYSYFFVETSKISDYLKIIQNPDIYCYSHGRLIQFLRKLSFVVDDNYDEFAQIIDKRNKHVEELTYKTVILPTYNCNYHCWYCIQRHHASKFSENSKSLIVKHVCKYLIDNKILSYQLAWFGGEPLMEIDDVIQITTELKSFCNSNHIYFNASITSNGALLNEKAIKSLANVGMNHYQITVDGCAEEHDKIKFDLSAESSQALVLSNIRNLLMLNDEASVSLRINYTSKTLESDKLSGEVNAYIHAKYRNRVSVDFQKVWQVNIDDAHFEKLLHLQREFSEAGYVLSSANKFELCYVDKTHQNMFFYNGTVDKCDNYRPDNARGFINDNGDIEWNESPVFHNIDIFSSDCVCSKCRYLPLCFGSCPVKREVSVDERGRYVCQVGNKEELFSRKVVEFCLQTQLNFNHDVR